MKWIELCLNDEMQRWSDESKRVFYQEVLFFSWSRDSAPTWFSYVWEGRLDFLHVCERPGPARPWSNLLIWDRSVPVNLLAPEMEPFVPSWFFHSTGLRGQAPQACKHGWYGRGVPSNPRHGRPRRWPEHGGVFDQDENPRKPRPRGDLGGSVDGLYGVKQLCRGLDFPHFRSQAEGAIQSFIILNQIGAQHPKN